MNFSIDRKMKRIERRLGIFYAKMILYHYEATEETTAESKIAKCFRRARKKRGKLQNPEREDLSRFQREINHPNFS